MNEFKDIQDVADVLRSNQKMLRGSVEMLYATIEAQKAVKDPSPDFWLELTLQELRLRDSINKLSMEVKKVKEFIDKHFPGQTIPPARPYALQRIMWEVQLREDNEKQP